MTNTQTIFRNLYKTEKMNILKYKCRLEVLTILAVLPTTEPKQAPQGDTTDGPLRTPLHQ